MIVLQLKRLVEQNVEMSLLNNSISIMEAFKIETILFIA